MEILVQPIHVPDDATMPERIDLEQLVSANAAAKEIRVSAPAVRRYCRNYRDQTGAVRLPCILVGEGKTPMIPRSALEAFRSSYKKGVMNGKRRPTGAEVAVDS